MEVPLGAISPFLITSCTLVYIVRVFFEFSVKLRFPFIRVIFFEIFSEFERFPRVSWLHWRDYLWIGNLVEKGVKW